MKRILITLGDAAGVGPEVIVKNLSLFQSQAGIEPVIIGEKWILQETAELLKRNAVFCSETENAAGAVKVRSLGILNREDVTIGRLSAKCGDAAYQYFTGALQSCMRGEAAGIVTAPLNKEAMNLAGHHFLGHTDILEQVTGQATVMTLFYAGLLIPHVTDHMPLRKALDAITADRIVEVVKVIRPVLNAIGHARPRIALAGINPHAGENGILGSEEKDIIAPAIKQLEAEGFPVLGPFPPDTVFMEALKGKFDAVVAMYHDQGFLPIKTLDLAHGVNCTLGIPFVRTSPDHGTAFNIAGKGEADPTSMEEAWKLACRLLDA